MKFLASQVVWKDSEVWTCDDWIRPLGILLVMMQKELRVKSSNWQAEAQLSIYILQTKLDSAGCDDSYNHTQSLT